MELNNGEKYEFERFRVEPADQTLWLGDEKIPLPIKAVEVLTVLVENRGRTVSKEELMEKVWPGTFVEENNLAVMISKLRKAFADGAGPEAKIIETVARRGYRFVAPVVKVGRPEVLLERVTEETLTIEREALPPASNREPFAKYAALGAFALLAVGALAFLAYQLVSKRVGPSASAPAIAVLPLRNLSPDKNDEYLGLGFTDALISKLAGIKGVNVRPTSSVLALTPEQSNAKSIREKLAVDKYVEGTIQRADGKVRISMQLVDSVDGSVVWAEQFDDDAAGLLRLQDRISNQIVSSMRTAITPNESELLARRYTSNPQAFDAYLRGRYYWNKRSGEDMAKAVGFFEEAKAKDPAFVMAYIGLSDAYQLLGEYSGGQRAASAEKARENILKAISMNDSVGEAHCSLAYLKAFYDWDFAAADASFKRAFELAPNYPTVHQWYGEFLLATGRKEESLAELKRAKELDPLSPIILTDIVAFHYVTRDFDAAIAEGEAIVQTYPKFAFAHSLIAMSALEKGDQAGFYKWAMSADEIYYPPPVVESRRAAYEQGGIDGLHKARYLQATNPPINAFLNDYQRAIDAVSAREYEAALGWLEKSVAGHERWVINLNQDPHWDPLRKDPRFAEILGKMNFR